MTLTEKERFIYHAATLMTMKIMSKEFHLMPVNVHGMISLIRNNRCRKLNDEDVDSIYTDIQEEVLLASSVYDMKDREVFSH